MRRENLFEKELKHMAEEQNQVDSLKELKPQISRLMIGNYENWIEHSYENGRSCRFLH